MRNYVHLTSWSQWIGSFLLMKVLAILILNTKTINQSSNFLLVQRTNGLLTESILNLDTAKCFISVIFLF